MRQAVNSSNYQVPIDGFSQSVVVSGGRDLVFVSGLTGRNAEGAVVGSDVGTQMVQILQNLRNVLQESGLTLDDVVSIRTYIVDIDGWSDIEPIWRDAWGDVWPASTMVEVTRLFDSRLLVEVEATAAVRTSEYVGG